MEIQINPHTLERAYERGTNEDEIEDVINSGFQFLQSMAGQEKPKYTILTKSDKGSFMSKREWKCFILLIGIF